MAKVRARARRAWFGLYLALAAVLATPGSAWAHDPFAITSAARVHADRIELRVTMSHRTAAKVCLGALFPPAKVAPAEFEKERPAWEACARGLYQIRAGGTPLTPRSAAVVLTEENDVEATIVYPPPSEPDVLFDAVHLRRLSDPLYGAELTVTGEGVFLGQELLRADQSTLQVVVPAPSSAQAGQGAWAAPSSLGQPVTSFGQYLRLGIEHILTGYDHLLFLGGLLLACKSFRSVLGIVSCFTLAHSITLALAALDVIVLPGRLVEPLIAATIVFVGVENLVRGDEPKGRWALAFTFGLFHGFGFAGALKQIGLHAPGTPFLAPLFAFNLGVEIGQAAVAAALLPILWKLRSRPRFARHGAQVLSLLIGAVGLYWLALRALS